MKETLTSIKNIKELKDNTNIKAFKFETSSYNHELFQDLCIEISKHMVQSKSNKNGEIDPFVGALLVKEKSNKRYECIGCARSAFKNGDHAEFTLLLTILNKVDVENCYLYASLEPCSKESRSVWNDSCSEIIADRRIKKVYVGILDPNPYIAGNGINHLLNKGVEIEFFDTKHRKLLEEVNYKFISQFKNGDDPRVNRRVNKIISKYISKNAIIKFMDQFTGTTSDLKDIRDVIFNFNQMMIENHSIIAGNSLMPIEVIKEFAMFFYNSPFHYADCATIRYKFPILESGEQDFIDFNGPYIFAYESNESKEENHSFLQMINKAYRISNKYDKNAVIKFLKDKLDENAEEIVREAFLNALIHRDYDNNYTFTTITFNENNITIENPINKKAWDGYELSDLKEAFNKKEIRVNVINPKLMRYFQLYNQCERNNNGMFTLKKCSKLNFSINNAWILKTTINFRYNK